MNNINNIKNIVENICNRKYYIAESVSHIQNASTNKNVLADEYLLNKLNIQHIEYLTELELLEKLEKFYSTII
jgi:2-hydroxy-3-keto-5-methylthiopentenyl-1-phosphate phosphatase